MESISGLKKEQAIALFKLLSFSIEDEKAGRVISSAKLKEKLATLKNSLVERN